jgi:hypothetical protein
MLILFRKSVGNNCLDVYLKFFCTYFVASSQLEAIIKKKIRSKSYCSQNFLELQKLKTRNNIIHKLAGTSWGLDLVYSRAEYFCRFWKNSTHVNKIDAELNTTLRIITNTLKSTTTLWLHVLAHIIPYNIRRKYIAKRIWNKFQNSPNMYSIAQDMANLPPYRLKPRKSLWKEEILMQPFSRSDYWKATWQDVDIFNKNVIEDPTKQVPGFDLARKIWCKLNRFRTGHGK